jgi:hypothetical protein
VVFRITVASTGQTVVGVNWCGGGSRQRDPVGDSEPTKTAITRAARRAWKQVAEVLPTFGAEFASFEVAAKGVNDALIAADVEVNTQRRIAAPTKGFSLSADYETAAAAPKLYDAKDVPTTEIDESQIRNGVDAARRVLERDEDPYQGEVAA